MGQLPAVSFEQEAVTMAKTARLACPVSIGLLDLSEGGPLPQAHCRFRRHNSIVGYFGKLHAGVLMNNMRASLTILILMAAVCAAFAAPEVPARAALIAQGGGDLVEVATPASKSLSQRPADLI